MPCLNVKFTICDRGLIIWLDKTLEGLVEQSLAFAHIQQCSRWVKAINVLVAIVAKLKKSLLPVTSMA